jgi:hypothetical protein
MHIATGYAYVAICTYISNIIIHTRVRAQVECDDGTFTVYTAGFETGANGSVRDGSTVAVYAHVGACVRLLLSLVLTRLFIAGVLTRRWAWRL